MAAEYSILWLLWNLHSSWDFHFFFFNLWLCWVFVSVRGLSLFEATVGHSSSRCAGLSLSRPFLLRSTGSRRAGSVIVAHGPSCSAACGILPDQGLHPCPLHWQADSQSLRHQGSPQGTFTFFKLSINSWAELTSQKRTQLIFSLITLFPFLRQGLKVWCSQITDLKWMNFRYLEGGNCIKLVTNDIVTRCQLSSSL